jgi:hypothetical protein
MNGCADLYHRGSEVAMWTTETDDGVGSVCDREGYETVSGEGWLNESGTRSVDGYGPNGEERAPSNELEGREFEERSGSGVGKRVGLDREM